MPHTDPGYAIVPDVFARSEMIDVLESLSTADLQRTRTGARDLLALPCARRDDARQRRVGPASNEVRSAWERLDGEFLQYPDDLTSLLYAWVETHPKEFGDVR